MYRPPNRSYSPSCAVEGGDRNNTDYYDPARAARDRDGDHHERGNRDYGRDRDRRDAPYHDRDRGSYQSHRERSPPRRYDQSHHDHRRYDNDRDRVPPPRRYDNDRSNDRVPPPRQYDDDRGRRYDDRDGDSYRRHDDRDRDHGHGHGRGNYNRHRDSRDAPPRGPERDREQPSSPSSRDVIFLGLDPQLSETDLAGFLRNEHGAQLESTKVVRDRSGQSKCFGFAMFATLKDAEQFVYDNFPTVTMPALFAHSTGKRVKIDFAGSRGERDGGAGGGIAAGHPPPVRGHDGTRDIGQPDGTQRVLLLRGLDPGTYAGEVARRMAEEVARMVGKAVREAEGTITRVAMIVDRQTEGLWSFAFVEMVTPELAGALLPFLLSPQHQPNGFLISQVPIAASFANPNAFIPTPAGPLGGQFLVRSSPNGGIGSATITHPDGEWCAYWHQGAGAAETVPRSAPPVPTWGAQLELSDETRTFLGRLAGVQVPQPPPGLVPMGGAPTGAAPIGFAPIGFSATASSATDAPLAVQPIKIGINLGGAVKKKGPVPGMPMAEDAIIPISHKNILGGDDEETDPGKDSVLLSRTKGAKIIPPTSTSRKIAKNINKWNNKQTELAAPPPPKDLHPAPRGASSVNAIAVGVRPAAPAAAGPSTTPATTVPAPPATEDDFDYTDASTFATTGKGACLLCQRQFKTEDILRKHTNLADATIREAGRKRKEAAVGTPATAAETEPKYRDRAAERREVFNQPEKPSLPPPTYRKGGLKPIPGGAAGGGADKPAAAAPAVAPVATAPPAADSSNVGNKLLAKMGWTAGSGLGAAADGRVEPIAVQQFDERVGLGAAKGREAGKWAGPQGWHERKKDMTKERYEAADQNGQ